ncbi:hypothetical protein M758_UG323100 [Ceratodon purpureus]|nr:hypothetical protein M758_UG323100 [Ceratodon purpureus]
MRALPSFISTYCRHAISVRDTSMPPSLLPCNYGLPGLAILRSNMYSLGPGIRFLQEWQNSLTYRTVFVVNCDGSMEDRVPDRSVNLFPSTDPPSLSPCPNYT